MEEKETKKGNMIVHAILGIVILAAVAIIIRRLIIWNGRSVTVDLDEDKGQYKQEVQDYYAYVDPADQREDDGVKRIVVLGNSMANNSLDEHSFINILKEKFDGEVIDLTSEMSYVSSQSHENETLHSMDGQCFFYMAKALCGEEVAHQWDYSGAFFFDGDARLTELEKRVKETDLSKVDTLLIMYSFSDYLGNVVRYYPPQPEFITTYYGALSRGVKMLREKFPNLRIVIASGFPMFFETDDGKTELGYTKTFGQGNVSEYFNIEYKVSQEEAVSFIDNYYHVINEDNIKDYVRSYKLNDAGIDLVTAHVLEFLQIGTENGTANE